MEFSPLHGHHNSPRYHEDADPPAGPHQFENNVARDFKNGIREEEDRQGKIVLRTSESKVFHHSCYLCIANIATIQKSQDVQQGQHREQSVVDLAKNTVCGFVMIVRLLRLLMELTQHDESSTYIRCADTISSVDFFPGVFLLLSRFLTISIRI